MGVVWVGSPNFWSGRPRGPAIAVVIHTMGGSLESTDHWFGDPSSEVSAHFGVSLTGEIHDYVHTFDRAWANGIVEVGSIWPQLDNGNPNDLTVSIETEDLGDPLTPVSPEQYDAVRTLVRTVHARFDDSLIWILRHSDISPISRPNCPGERWQDEIEQLAIDTGLSLFSQL